MSASEVRVQVGYVFLAYVENDLKLINGDARRISIHIRSVSKGQICWCEGVDGKPKWEEAHTFMKRKPLHVGHVRKKNFWCRAEYIFNDDGARGEMADLKKRNTELQVERRKLFTEAQKAKTLLAEAESTVSVLMTSMSRDEANRQWVIRDDMLCMNDKTGNVRGMLPK
jgi:hypothetical protein